MKPASSPLIWLVLLFVVSRLLYLVLIDPRYLLGWLSEELSRGTIAQELVTGLTLPFAEYRADDYSGGSLMIGALAAGFFLLFGPTVFSLKLAPLLLFTLTLVFWYRTIQQAAGDRVAGYFAILFCFSPPLVTAYSVTAMGFHSESIVFSALTVLLFFRMLAQEQPAPTYPLLLGLTAGFGLWFTYVYGLTLLAMLGCWFWCDNWVRWRSRALLFVLGFLVGFSPWLVFNFQNHFSGLVIHGTNVWEHFGVNHLWDGLARPRELAPVEFLRTIGSEDSWDLYRRAVNLPYSLLYLVPLLTAGTLWLKKGKFATAGAGSTRLTLVGFSLLYLAVFALAVQFSDFRRARYFLPAYPFLFFLSAYSIAYCQDRFPPVHRQIQTVFLASVVVLGLGAHAPLLSLGRPGVALSAKGYSYASMLSRYWDTPPPAGSGKREFPLDVDLVQRSFLSTLLPKLSRDDERKLSLGLAQMLAKAVPSNGQTEDFARIAQMVPPGFDAHFYFWLGANAIERTPHELPKAVEAVEFVRRRSPASHHLALIGIYQAWPWVAALDRPPRSLVKAPVAVAPDLSPHFWRALGSLAGRYWYETDRSMTLLSANLQRFVPRLDPSVQRSFLQGVGELLLFARLIDSSAAPAELEHFPPEYQEGIFEGWGMALGEFELFSIFPWDGHESLLWMAATKGLSGRSLVSVQEGKVQFETLFEGPAARINLTSTPMAVFVPSPGSSGPRQQGSAE